MKNVADLTPNDLQAFPVWRFVSTTNRDLHVRPVRRLPVRTLNGLLVGTRLQLSDGRLLWALLGNVDEDNPEATEHFLTVSLFWEGRWFHLARYHDPDYLQRGPLALAEWLGLPLTGVFPLHYDIRSLVRDGSERLALVGEVLQEPRERLSIRDLMRLAVPKPKRA